MSTRKPSAPRHYGDDEVRQLIEHATQLQQAGEPEDPEEGVTLAELEEAAAAVGIRPRYIRRAAALLGNPGAKADWAGGPSRPRPDRRGASSVPARHCNGFPPTSERGST